MKQYLKLFDFKQQVEYKNEILSGLTVALALVPEAVAFALIAGLSPLTGLYAAVVMGFVTSVLGGRPGMISGATGAVAVVIVSLARDFGVEYVFAAVVLAGVFQLSAGFLKLGKLMRLVPHPVIFGFVNGLAVIIFTSQLAQFKSLWRLSATDHAHYLGIAKVEQGHTCVARFHFGNLWFGRRTEHRYENGGRYCVDQRGVPSFSYSPNTV
jgi:MFS superfamily sulfate permease-like transporter